VYWLEIDYLQLAAAAARCGAHFTALLYIEAWQEARHGWLAPLGTPPPAAAASAAGEGEAAVAQRLLLDVCSQISEPDAIYAFSRSHGLLSQVRAAGGTGGEGGGAAGTDASFPARPPHDGPLSSWASGATRRVEPPRHAATLQPCLLLVTTSQLKRYEHEGDWSRALLAYDLVLQHLGGGTGQGGTPGATQQQQQVAASQLPSQLLGGSEASQASGGSRAAGGGHDTFEGISRQAAVAGLLRSLSHLGASHLLGSYARAPGAADTAEQAALSLGQWGQLDGGAGSGGGPSAGAAAAFSADAVLSAALAGLQGGSQERCRHAVCCGRRRLVGGLVTASLEGAAHANPALVQLQMLQGVSEAWELGWPAQPDLGSLGSPRKRRQRDAPASNGGALLPGVLQLWRAREASAGAGGRYDLQAPLQVSWGEGEARHWRCGARGGSCCRPCAVGPPRTLTLPPPPSPSGHAPAPARLPARPGQAGRLARPLGDGSPQDRCAHGWLGPWCMQPPLPPPVCTCLARYCKLSCFAPCRPLCPGHNQPLQAARPAASASSCSAVGSTSRHAGLGGCPGGPRRGLAG
jgi:hypothetical protein